MSKIEKDSRLRRERDILDRLENVKRLIEMETTLLTVEGARYWCHMSRTTRDGKQIGDDLLHEVRDEIQLQLLSITALCYGDNPDLGEPAPMLEWNYNNDDKHNEHPEDRFRHVWDECLQWNA